MIADEDQDLFKHVQASPAGGGGGCPSYRVGKHAHAEADESSLRAWCRTEQFVEFYYNAFDADRKGLVQLYVCARSDGQYRQGSRLTPNRAQRENSMLTFESTSTLGAGPIVEKLVVRWGRPWSQFGVPSN